MDPLTLILTFIAGQTGVSMPVLLGYVGILVAAANMISRWIPDDATGVLNVVRQICKFIGMNVSSRISSGVTLNDAAKVTMSFPEAQAKIDDIKAA